MSSKTSKYTEDWITVKNIANGMIELDNNEKVTGVKIRPRNIFILDTNTRSSIIASLRNFYDAIDFEFWLISTDRPVDISNYMATLQVQYNQVSDSRIRKIISQDIEKANEFTKTVTDTEFYILFKDKSAESIQKRLRTLMMGLSNAGLENVQVSNTDLRIVLDSFFNAGMTIENKVVLPDER